MKCIVGLGNPGKKYEKTRHNIGFMVVDELLSRYGWKLTQKKFRGKFTLEHLNGEKLILLQPQTFMNLSGQSVQEVLDFYQIEIENLLVIYDDLDLPVGKIRLRESGGHGGHNGVRSLIDHLQTKKFKRIRLGIGRPTNEMPIVDYVLTPFTKEQSLAVDSSIEKAADACLAWLEKPFQEIMNDYNQ